MSRVRCDQLLTSHLVICNRVYRLICARNTSQKKNNKKPQKYARRHDAQREQCMIQHMYLFSIKLDLKGNKIQSKGLS